jgi:hypothetical protein
VAKSAIRSAGPSESNDKPHLLPRQLGPFLA